MEYLEPGNIVSSRIVPRDIIESRLEELQRLPETPEIEWRPANLNLGMSAYFENDSEVATSSLRKALDGRAYPIDAATQIFSTAPRLPTRSNAATRLKKQLINCFAAKHL